MIVYILIFLHFISAQAYKFQKPIAEKIWSVRCKSNELVLNDCNWCSCDQNHHFKCKARVCEEVDPFGHFKDTILETDVGMEGHGAWRSRPTSCKPGVQYERGTTLCICDVDGNWPNPVCRDLFRVLHAIEVIENKDESISQICTPTKLYLVGCNACFCPSSGRLDMKFCTNRTCSDSDPVLEPKDIETITTPAEPKYTDGQVTDSNAEGKDTELTDATDTALVIQYKNELEIYALCTPKKIYTIGHQNFECLANNRLILCKDCADNITRKLKTEQQIVKSKPSACNGKIGKVIQVNCNFCKCSTKGYMYCTTKKCIPRNKTLSRVFRKPKHLKSVKAPVDDLDCIPGTMYKRDCNKCYCKVEKEKKVFDCTVNSCQQTSLYDMVRDCVSGTSYEIDCYICTCDIINGEKHQACKLSSRCSNSLLLKETRSDSLNSLHGYCEPLHVYKKDCNTCKCLSDGKLVRCTTHICAARSSEPVEVELVPLQQAEREFCPTGHSYKVGCNLCVCLSNGNAICTTTDCSNQLVT